MQNVIIRTTEQLDFRAKEAYKTLRTNLSFAGKDIKVISLTSCTPSEGKSSVSFQLCMSLAESGKKTILVDADMRKSVLRGRYKASREKYGLSHYLSGQAEFDDVCCRTNIENLDIIFAGPVPPNPSELLTGERYETLIELLRWKYDYVIVDTPPLGSVVDGAVASAYCDGAVIVIESGAVSHKFVRSIKEQLDRVGCRVLGCVLNKVDLKKSGYYKKYYGYYSGYGYYGNSENGEGEIPLSPVRKEQTEKAETTGEVKRSDTAEIEEDCKLQEKAAEENG